MEYLREIESAVKCIVLDDTIARKVNSSDRSAFAKICGCCITLLSAMEDVDRMRVMMK